MAKLKEMMTVVSQREIARDIFELVLSGELVQAMNQPGRFLNLAVPNPAQLLRRPISISSWDKKAGTCTLIYRIGSDQSGTYELSKLGAGDTADVLGPLGHGFEVTENQEVLVVGGGIGVPPLYELTKQLIEKRNQVTVLLGFASKAVKILEKEFLDLGVTMKIATDDGSYGEHGHVGLLMDALNFTPDAVFSCGAPLMLQAVAKKYSDTVANVQLSMEARMACGIGACYACVVHTPEGPAAAKKVCEDGPVFQSKEVVL
ncbi:MAG: dihydroorotate dehydrogenase electron transfer subunit [Streptococcaceae bacterium]|nr:dihydroorotate dehydrogenase electron transfer subunit [Streptococcaceae bacterium]